MAHSLNQQLSLVQYFELEGRKGHVILAHTCISSGYFKSLKFRYLLQKSISDEERSGINGEKMNLAFCTWGSLNLHCVSLRHSVHLLNTTFLTSRCIGNLRLCSKRLVNQKDCEVEINPSYFPGCLSINAKQRWK